MLTRLDELVDTALAVELRIDLGLERNRHAVLGRNRPTLAARALDQHVLRLELVPCRAKTPTLELLEITLLECGANLAELLAKTRAERGQVWLHPQLRVDRREDDLLDAELVGDLGDVRSRGEAALDNEPPQRLLHLHPRGLPRLMAKANNPPNVGDLGE